MAKKQKINMEKLIQEWAKAREHNEQYTTDFPDLDSIVDGIPLHREKGSPFVGDTTLGGLVRMIPRESIQQLPIFGAVVNGTKNSLPAIVCSYLLRRKIFNQDTFGKGLLSTLQVGGEEALKHGYAPFMVALGSMYDEYGTSLRLMHYSDVAGEPGMQDYSESGFWYVEADLTPSRVRKIRDRAEGNESTTWEVEALNELLELDPDGSDYSQYLSGAREINTDTSSAYKFVTRYEVGSGGRFVTFCPQIGDKPLRVMENKSKFGYSRVMFLVIDPAPLTPYGVSRVRLASPNQNLMNAYYQNIAAMFILNSRPPVLQRGRFLSPVHLKQGARWITKDQNATVELKEMSNSSLQSFVNIGSQMVAQMQSAMGVPGGNLNGGSNTSGYSKTAPGVKMQQQDRDASNTQITNLFENFLRQYGLVGLDVLISEQTGSGAETELIVDDEAKNAINRLAQDEFVPDIDPETGMPTEFMPPIGSDNVLTINWDDFYANIHDLHVEIELGLGKDELEERQRASLEQTMNVMGQNAEQIPGGAQKAAEIADRLLEKTVPESKRINYSASPQQPPMEAPAEAQLTQ